MTDDAIKTAIEAMIDRRVRMRFELIADRLEMLERRIIEVEEWAPSIGEIGKRIAVLESADRSG